VSKRILLQDIRSVYDEIQPQLPWDTTNVVREENSECFSRLKPSGLFIYLLYYLLHTEESFLRS